MKTCGLFCGQFPNVKIVDCHGQQHSKCCETNVFSGAIVFFVIAAVAVSFSAAQKFPECYILLQFRLTGISSQQLVSSVTKTDK